MRFKMGQIVRFVPGTHERAYGGLYEVVGRLPEERGERQYRLKSTNDNHERIVRESQINNTSDEPSRGEHGAGLGKAAADVLSAPERISLRRLISGTAPVAIPIGHLSRFRHLGLTATTSVGEALTEKGKAEAARRMRGGP